MGENWLQQLAVGRIGAVVAAERRFSLLTKEILVMYALVVAGILIYQFENTYFSYALAIIAIIVPGALGWPALSELHASTTEKETPSIICFPMAYTIDDEKILVTLINSGNMVILGEFLLAVGWFEKKGRKLDVVTLGRNSLYWTYRILEKGEIIRIPESVLHEGFAELLGTMTNEQLQEAVKYEAKLLFMVTTATYIPPTQELELSGLVTGCNVGINFGWAKSQLDHHKPLWVQEGRVEVDSKELTPNTLYSGTLQTRTPPTYPSIKELLFKILEKLETLSKKS